jgi:hypothetical protein
MQIVLFLCLPRLEMRDRLLECTSLAGRGEQVREKPEN